MGMRRSWSGSFIVVMAVLTTAGVSRAEPEGKHEAVALLPTKLKGKLGVDVELLDETILTAVQSLARFRVVGQDDMNAVIGFEKQKDLLGCDKSSCFAEIGGALGVDMLLAVQVGALKGERKFVVTSKVIAIAGGTPNVTARSVDYSDATDSALLAAVPSIIAKLFGGGGLQAATQAPPTTTSQAPAQGVEIATLDSTKATSVDAITCEGAECKLLAACKKGDAASCYGFGARVRQQGYGIPEETQRATVLLTRACELGSGVACQQLGSLFQHDNTVKPDLPRSAKFYERGCELKDGQSCQMFGMLYFQGTGGFVRDLYRANVLFKQGCEAGYQGACPLAKPEYEVSAQLASELHYGISGTKKDIKRAVELYEKACDEGSATACMNLGSLHLQGEGVARDLYRSNALYKRACELGQEASCNIAKPTVEIDNQLAGEYQHGIMGTPKNVGKAVELYQRACTGKVAIACMNLGNMYFSGMGVEQDQGRGKQLFRQACEHGLDAACQLMKSL